jgi:hypothetical protein
MAQFRTSKTFDVILVLLLGGFIWWAAVNRVAVGDWVYFLSYQPDAKTVQIADSAGLSELGRKLLYRSHPEFADKDTVTAACDIERLGCIDPKGHIFILDDPTKPAQTTVTAAHEMLHLAYRRLSAAQKADLAPLLDEAIATNGPLGLTDELADLTTADDRRDEAHSLLGTEYHHLPSALETYYTTYFTNRSQILSAADHEIHE